MFRGVRADIQLAVHPGFGECAGIVHQCLNRFGHADGGGNQFIVVAPPASAVADLLQGVQIVQITLGDVVQHRDGMSNPVLNQVHRLGDIVENARILPAHRNGIVVIGHPLQDGIRLDQPSKPVDAGVQVVLDLVEIAAVVFGDLRRDVALGDAVDVFRRHVQRPDHRVEGIVHPLHDPAEIALVLRGIRTGVQFPFNRRLRQRAGVSDQRQHIGAESIDRSCQCDLFAGEIPQRVGQISLGVLIKSGYCFQHRSVERIEYSVDALRQFAVHTFQTGAIDLRIDFPRFLQNDRAVEILCQEIQRIDAQIQVVLDLVEIAIVIVGDFRRDVALGNTVDVFRRHVQRPDDGVEDIVHPGDYRPVLALMFRGVRADIQFAVHSGIGERAGVVHQRLNRFDHADKRRNQFVGVAPTPEFPQGVDIMQVARADVVDNPDDRAEPLPHCLDGCGHVMPDALELDLRRRVVLGHVIHRDFTQSLIDHINRLGDRGHERIHPLDNFPEVAVMHRGLGPDIQTALDRGGGKGVDIGHEQIDRIDAAVQVVLDLVEIALVGFRDLLRDISLRDAVHVLRGHVQGADDRIERVVEAHDDFPEIALELGRIAAGVQFAFHRRFCQRLGFRHHILENIHHLLESAGKLTDLIPGIRFDPHIEIAASHFLRRGRERVDRLANNPGDENSEKDGEEDTDSQDDQHQLRGGFRLGGVGVGLFLGVGDFQGNHFGNGVIFRLGGCLHLAPKERKRLRIVVLTRKFGQPVQILAVNRPSIREILENRLHFIGNDALFIFSGHF